MLQKLESYAHAYHGNLVMVQQSCIYIRHMVDYSWISNDSMQKRYSLILKRNVAHLDPVSDAP